MQKDIQWMKTILVLTIFDFFRHDIVDVVNIVDIVDFGDIVNIVDIVTTVDIDIIIDFLIIFHLINPLA